MRIDWQVIEHHHQRYESSGDWFWTDDGETLNIRVSRLSRREWEFCLGLHETIEAMLCYFAGIDQKRVDTFDMPYEEAYQRKDEHFPCGCPYRAPSDPGSDPHAPYAFQHKIADACERVVAAVLGIHWPSYDAEVDQPPR